MEDFDGDGRIDLAAAERIVLRHRPGLGELRVYEGEPNGFRLRTILHTEEPLDVRTSRLDDEDALPGFLIAGPSGVSVVRNLADFRFQCARAAAVPWTRTVMGAATMGASSGVPGSVLPPGPVVAKIWVSEKLPTSGVKRPVKAAT